MATNFDKYAQDANRFINSLAARLGHPNETARTAIILRSVLHTLRDRLTVSESLDLLAQLPMFIKGVYVDNWKYLERPTSVSTVEDFKEEVKRHQDLYGEYEFNWNNPTEEIVLAVLDELSNYTSDGEARHIIAQLPEGLKDFFSVSLQK